MLLRWFLLMIIQGITSSEEMTINTLTYNRVTKMTDISLVRDWIKSMSLPVRYECPDNDDKDINDNDNDGHSEGAQILQVINCDEEGARYDYTYTGNKKHNKFVGNGRVKISSLLMTNKDHQMKEGIRTGRCVLPFDSNVISVSGNFDKDLLNGPVRVELANDSFILGTARLGKFHGIVRFFDTKETLLRVEIVDNAGVARSWSWMYGRKLDSLDYEDNDQGVRSAGGVLAFRGKDGLVIFVLGRVMRCKAGGYAPHVLECRNVTVEVKENNCFVGVENVKEVEGEGKFLLKTHFLEFSDEGDVNKCDDIWKNKNVSEGIKRWIYDVSNGDPFWREQEESDPIKPDAVKLNLEGVIDIGRNDLLKNDGYFKIDKTKMKENKKYKFHDENDETFLSSKSGKEPFFIEGRAKGGAIHGIARIFGRNFRDPRGQCHHNMFPGLGFVGEFRNGKPKGICWKGLVGGAWLYGEVDELGEFTGENFAYIYQDLNTALFGTFKKGLMVSGREVDITGYRCIKGILILRFSSPKGPIFHYDPATKNSFGDQPLVQDPLDKKYIRLAPSVEIPEAGEGAFAKRDIPAGTVVILYGGYVMNKLEREALGKQQTTLSEEKGWAINSTEATSLWKNRFYVKECGHYIDIPPQYAHESKYRATLGHKVNHKFPPNNNCRFDKTDSARFGPILSVVTKRDIKQGEELFANYGYINTFLPWYNDQRVKHKKKYND